MAFTQADLDTLDTAIASGTRRVKFQDREQEFQSVKDMIDARTLIVIELNRANSTRFVRQIRVTGCSGY